MAEQRIEAPTTNDVDRIAHLLIHAEALINDALGQKLDGTTGDLELIQTVLDRNLVGGESTYSLQALGMAFGKVFVNENAGYDWWMVEDEYGRDPAIRYEKTSLLAFPLTMISKRIEDGERVDIIEMYQGLRERLEDLKREI